MKTYTFIPNQKKNNNSFNISFLGNNTDSTNYSALLDDIISANLMKTNSYLKKAENDNFIDAIISEAKGKNSKSLKGDFITALTYLAGFGTITKLPFKLGHTYYFDDDTPIIFHLDSIQIGNTEYYYDDLLNKTFAPATKKTIIDIYLNGNKNAKININL